MGIVNLHDTTFSPAGLWQFNNNGNDSSGNGFTLTLGAGTERYADIYPGVRGLVLDGSSYMSKATFTSTLGFTGDMTIELLVSLGINTINTVFVAHVGNTGGEGSTDNYLYQLAIVNSPPMQQRNFWETGNGTNIFYAISDYIPLSGIFHWAVTRASGISQFYVNGRAIGAASSSLTNPTDGSAGTIKVGSDSGAHAPPSVISSVKVLGSALTAANIKAEYIKTLGNLYGS